MLSDPDISPLISEIASALGHAAGSTVRQSDMPAAMRAKLERSTFIFSGFKTHAELSAVSRLLSKDGVKTPFDTFMREVKAVNRDYNVNYLRAEYNFAVHSSRSAALWERFSKDTDRYYLQYRTAGDERVREDHRPLHDITLPFDDPFWAEYFPPNGWNCRCTAVRVRRSKYTPSDHDKAMAAGERATTSLDKHGNNRAAIFRFNPGAQETLFPPRHPYYKVPQADRQTITAAADTLATNMSFTIQREMAKQSSLFPTSKEHIPLNNLHTKELLVSNKPLERLLNHCRDIDELKAAAYVWAHPGELVFVRTETLGEGKDMTAAKNIKNIAKKKDRGVVSYNVYTVAIDGIVWQVKLEQHRKGFEQFYHIIKK